MAIEWSGYGQRKVGSGGVEAPGGRTAVSSAAPSNDELLDGRRLEGTAEPEGLSSLELRKLRWQELNGPYPLPDRDGEALPIASPGAGSVIASPEMQVRADMSDPQCRDRSLDGAPPGVMDWDEFMADERYQRGWNE